MLFPLRWRFLGIPCGKYVCFSVLTSSGQNRRSKELSSFLHSPLLEFLLDWPNAWKCWKPNNQRLFLLVYLVNIRSTSTHRVTCISVHHSWEMTSSLTRDWIQMWLAGPVLIINNKTLTRLRYVRKRRKIAKSFLEWLSLCFYTQVWILIDQHCIFRITQVGKENWIF